MSDKIAISNNDADVDVHILNTDGKHAGYHHKVNVKKMEYPLPLPMLNWSQRSLEPDMIFGWRPQKNKVILKTDANKHIKGSKSKTMKRNVWFLFLFLFILSIL